jgi:cation-transporting ATPase 13A3/4/5
MLVPSVNANDCPVPSDYEEVLASYTHRGYRVIACATKHIPKLSWIKAQKMKREAAECDMNFIGFIIFENKLKPQTTPIIAELKRAMIRNIMCTGDNILTAISVAKECGLIENNSTVFAPTFVKTADTENENQRTELHWESIDEQHIRLHPDTLLVS